MFNEASDNFIYPIFYEKYPQKFFERINSFDLSNIPLFLFLSSFFLKLSSNCQLSIYPPE